MAQTETAKIVASIIGLLESVDEQDRARVLRTVSTFFGDEQAPTLTPRRAEESTVPVPVPFSKAGEPTPKQFMGDKKPVTDVERVACLAYYLTHYRSTNHFKTVDISKLNTEAAQIRFSNPSFAVENALKTGYLAHAVKGHKQLSALGEQYVQTLPDREAARALHGPASKRRRAGKKRAKPQ